ncbi:hypothetical protein B0A54_01021 [Friedmanniomyces endolithicus]|uniref:AAA+ ATPase domain-containing protein n=1 Tax=Friedmanniomyces endolithicus TaxID=329885 RepID=A0A4U0VKL7_9PEZI|nr:hypothetical protein LTS09_009010 [Friedmanniomyces endolithicus]TKA48945.1 hypothetical protein B0A54_01021 [Friedmanniomyces endolithicus]
MATTAASTGLAITIPLVKYRALLATKQVLPDQSQFRLAIHLQKLYNRSKDYEPQVEYSARLDQISRAARRQQSASGGISENPQITPSRWRTFMAARESRNSLALTRRLTSHESAMQLTSPKGFMLHGEVGTGKSMLIDLFADCLPNSKKRRWHFNTFMLETFSKLEALRRSRTASSTSLASMTGQEDDYSLLWLAKDMVQTSPILFLDEFQMPDRVASKILTNLMTSFFHLGGVLIATSNRMPEELAQAAGEDYPVPAQSRLKSFGRTFWSRRKSRSSALFGGPNEFAIFLDVLKARCEVWEMGGGRDFRRLESGSVTAPTVAEADVEEWMLDGHEDLQDGIGMAGWPAPAAGMDSENDTTAKVTQLPKFYSTGENDEESLSSAIINATGQAHLDGVPWTSTAIRIYGRSIPIPRICNGVTMWTFDELCKSVLGPADYISIASLSHTIILTDVPIQTWLMKNEARRFITLLDALYECRCKLYISAAAGPDELFFPESDGKESDEAADSVYSETISDVYQDATAPFRPNILSQNPDYVEYHPEPDYTHARLAGKLAADALEDDPPNKPHLKPFGRSFGRTDGEMDRRPVDPDEERYTGARRKLDFGKTSRFTGEDERFAYKRAQSRLWEMCGARWWAREEEGWHRPLPVEARRWERLVAEDESAMLEAKKRNASGGQMGDAAMGHAMSDETRDERSFRTGASSSSSPFRNSEEPPPNISWTHIWGTMRWGEKAGKWGQGPAGLKEKDKDDGKQ